MKKFVAVAGNIGVGKSTLVSMLGSHLGWEPFYEPEAENPYLADFYKNMKKWAFQSQIFFLTQRLRAHRKLTEHPTSVIQDRSVYEDAEVFAKNLYIHRQIRKRDFRTYWELYQVFTEFLPPPDLVIYLRASVPTVIQRIQQRGRDYEQDISPDYLLQLNNLYEDWINAFNLCPVLTVPADDLDFVKHPGHRDLIIEKVKQKLTGKDEVIFNSEEVANGRR